MITISILPKTSASLATVGYSCQLKLEQAVIYPTYAAAATTLRRTLTVARVEWFEKPDVAYGCLAISHTKGKRVLGDTCLVDHSKHAFQPVSKPKYENRYEYGPALSVS